jgi:hypothetical protein
MLRFCLSGMLLLLSFGAHAQEDSTGNSACPLTCANGSVCVSGTASFADHKLPDGTTLDIHQTTSIQNYFCSCRQGWTGVACDVRWEPCSDTGDDNDTDAIHHC